MTIQVELQPELEDELSAEAEARGMDLEAYAQQLFQSALRSRQTQRSRASQEEFRAFLDAMALDGPAASHLAEDTFSRAMIYGDHD